MHPAAVRAEYDTEIALLRAELVRVEDTADSAHRAHEIRVKIRDLTFERDCIPWQER